MRRRKAEEHQDAPLTIERVGVADVLAGAVADAFDGAVLELTEAEDGSCRIGLRQPSLRRPLRAPELSDGTLRYLLLAAALLSPRPPGLLVLNEPESSLHPSLMPALAALVVDAAERSQVVLVTHPGDLVRSLRSHARFLELERSGGATTVAGQLAFEGPEWSWPRR